jgi:hypothetical protein
MFCFSSAKSDDRGTSAPTPASTAPESNVLELASPAQRSVHLSLRSTRPPAPPDLPITQHLPRLRARRREALGRRARPSTTLEHLSGVRISIPGSERAPSPPRTRPNRCIQPGAPVDAPVRSLALLVGTPVFTMRTPFEHPPAQVHGGERRPASAQRGARLRVAAVVPTVQRGVHPR